MMQPFGLPFGDPVEEACADAIIRRFTKTFFRDFDRRDISTHGPLWTRLACLREDVDGHVFAVFQRERCYILVERRRQPLLFRASTSAFQSYLLNRLDGPNFPMYVFDDEMDEFVCEWGENGNSKPMWLIHGKVRR